MNNNDLIDLHSHSIASVHAYSTLKENIEAAQEKGLKYYGLSDHGPGMKNTTLPNFFHNFKVIPSTWGDLHFLAGIELNIMNYHGKIDLDTDTLRKLDYAIASLHLNCLKPGTKEENTKAYLGAIKNPFVKIIGHPDDARYQFDSEPIIALAKQYHVLIEVNNASLAPNATRPGALELDTLNLKYCAQYAVPVIVNSDAHFYTDIGNHQYGFALLEKLDFPKELIVNYNEELIKEYFYSTAKL